MKHAKIEVTVNFPYDMGNVVDMAFTHLTLDEAMAKAIDANPDWTSIVLIVVKP